MGFDKSKLR